VRAAGFSYGQIAEALSISKSTAWNLVNGDRPPGVCRTPPIFALGGEASL